MAVKLPARKKKKGGGGGITIPTNMVMNLHVKCHVVMPGTLNITKFAVRFSAISTHVLFVPMHK